MKELYIRPEVKSEILEPEALANTGSPIGGKDDGGDGGLVGGNGYAWGGCGGWGWHGC